MRAFIRLTLDPKSALSIDRWCTQCWPSIARRVPLQNLHVTLAFLGKIDQASAVYLCDLLAESKTVPPFQMQLDRVGYWPEPQILWLGSSMPPEDVRLLADRCKQNANRAGIRVSGKRYEPHVTLARKPTSPPQPPLIEPSFTVRFSTFQFCESILDKRGARYVVREEWPLN